MNYNSSSIDQCIQDQAVLMKVNIVITSSLLSMNLIIDAVLRWHTTCNTYGNFNSAMNSKRQTENLRTYCTLPVFFIQKTDDLLTHSHYKTVYVNNMSSRPIECASPQRLVDIRIHHGDGSDPPVTVWPNGRSILYDCN